MGILTLFLGSLLPLAFVVIVIFDIVIITKKMSGVAKRTEQIREDQIRAAKQQKAQNDELAEKVDKLNNEINQYVRVKCPYCGSEVDARKGIQFTCEHCGFTSANIL